VTVSRSGRLLVSAVIVGALTSCADDRAARSPFPFTGTWIQVKATNPSGDHVTDAARIGYVSLAADQVVVALADQRRIVAVPTSALGSASSSSGCMSLGDGITLIATGGEGLVEQVVGETRIGVGARYLDLELTDVTAEKPIARARVWAEPSLRAPTVLSAPPAKPHAEPAKAVAAAESPAPADPADAAFLAAARQVGPELRRTAEEMVRFATASGARSPQVAGELDRGTDDQRRRVLRLLIQARYADAARSQPLLLDAARLQRELALFAAAAAAWSDARA
jgi:hypothetical protein